MTEREREGRERNKDRRLVDGTELLHACKITFSIDHVCLDVSVHSGEKVKNVNN